MAFFLTTPLGKNESDHGDHFEVIDHHHLAQQRGVPGERNQALVERTEDGAHRDHARVHQQRCEGQPSAPRGLRHVDEIVMIRHYIF
jgi:hypothetical protein